MDISDGIKSLMEFIDEDANPPVKQKPYWLYGKCMNSYSSRYYVLKKHRCTKTADGRRRRRTRSSAFLEFGPNN